MTPASGHLADLCQNAPTIAERFAQDPGKPVDRVVTRLRREWRRKTRSQAKEKMKGALSKEDEKSESDRLKWAQVSGKFPCKPSDLFLNVYADVLDSISRKPLSNLCSPSLVGSSGVVPLSIISVIPDIMRHYAHLIECAEHEVFLATNYWEDSCSSKLVADALRTLSRRSFNKGKGKERENEKDKIVVKIIYDRGSAVQLIRNHARVPPSKWESVGLPRPEELRGIRMEVLNYHRPIVGTFHAKYLVVDRKVACVNSNNVQDRPNVEMCVHLEGPIVDSFYDVALFSWANKMDPPLPLLTRSRSRRDDYKFGDENDALKYIDEHDAGLAAYTLLEKQHEREARENECRREKDDGRPSATSSTQVGNGSTVEQAVRAAAGVPGGVGGMHGRDEVVGEHPATSLSSDAHDSGIEMSNEELVPTDANQKKEGLNSGESSKNAEVREEKQDLEVRQNRPRSSTNLAPPPLPSRSNAPPASTDARLPHSLSSPSSSAVSISPSAPEVLKSEEDFSSSKSSKSKWSRLEAITRRLNGPNLNEKSTADDDDDDLDDFRPHIIHKPHKPVPIAMVNRAPRGTPGHERVRNVPQNVAWVSLIKHAKHSIFIQTPTFNASPLIPATLDACRRGVQVTLYLDLGFNDLGEMIPFQGGTNERVVHSMYNVLNREGRDKAENLKVYWYTAKDQNEPVSATKKSRNCHVKFMAVDSQVTMLGNGNQDTQSWFHSQETNILIDSAQLTSEWLAGIESNQSTRKFGLVDNTDGVWRARDGSGRIVQSSGVQPLGPITALKGMVGALRRHFRY